MVENYIVCHCGKEKKFRERDKAYAHADALYKLGYAVKVYYCLEGLFIQQKILIFASADTREGEILKKVREVKYGINKG